MITFQTPAILLLSILVVFAGYRALSLTGLKRTVGILNVIVALTLVFAAAGPEIDVSQQENLRPSVTVIQDSSESSSLINDWQSELDQSNLNVRTVNSDSESFEAQMRSTVEENESYLFVSDLRFDSDLPQYFVDNNVSMNLMTPEMSEENAVSIEGPDQTVIGAENRFTVDVSSTEEPVDVEAGVGNETLESGEPPLELDLSFDEQGYQNIWAEIDSQDEFSENNEYFKTVRVMEKPSVASIGESSGLEEELDEFYEIDSFENLPENLEEYDAVILKEQQDSQELRDYLVDGGGLMYTGGEYSSEYLPVRSVDRDESTDAPMIILTLDISIGTEESGAAKASKQIAYSLVEGLPENSRVGVVAYNRYSYDVIEPTLLASGREEVQSRISRLEPEGPTFHNNGLRAADSMISRNQGEGNTVLITDGKISTLAERNNVERESQIEADTLSGRLIAVGVGDTYPEEIAEEDREFLKDLAERTEGGFYVDGRSAGSLNLTFDAGGGSRQTQPLVVTDSTHFITEGYRPNATVFDIDDVEPTPASRSLVSTASGRPVLTTGRYGLGRIAAFSADNQNLESLMDQDPSLVGRTMSWSSGPLERDIWVEGSRIGDDFRVVSRERVDGFSRQSDERFTQEIKPNETGFHEKYNTSYSVNYRPEIEEIGYNERKFSSFTNNGNVYSTEEIGVFFDSIGTESVESTQSVSLTPYLVGLALMFYLGFVGLRKRNGLA